MKATEMLPPADEEVLRDNPDFANLYSTLINVVLDRDGSTKHDLAPEDQGRNLAKQRLETARRIFLTHATNLTSPPEAEPSPSSRPLSNHHWRHHSTPELPEALLDILLLAPILDAGSSISPESAALLMSKPPLSNLDTLLPELAALVSSSLCSTALDVASLIHPSANTSYLHRHIPCLPQDHSNLLTSLSTAQQSLTATRLRICASLAHLLECDTQSLIYLVRSLEAKHGVVARSLELRASDVSLRAQRTEVEASQAAHSIIKDLYSPQAVAALRGYASQLQNAKFRVADRVHSLQAKLQTYGVNPAKTGQGQMDGQQSDCQI